MSRPTSADLQVADDQMCFGCGRRNPRGLHLKFDLDAVRKVIKTRWIPTKEFQGYADITHGGMIALILDELMVNLLWSLRQPAVTAQMEVRFHRPARVGEPVEFHAHIGTQKGRTVQMKSTVVSASGELVASASATCVRVSHFKERKTTS